MIDVIVINYRTPDDLMNFIESYRQTAPENCHLTVVDVDPIIAIGYKNVPGTLITTPINGGYSYAVNNAVAMTDGDIIGIFNADVILMEGTIEKCAAALRINNDWANLGPLQYDSKGLVTAGGVLGTQEAPYQRGWHGSVTEEFRDVRDDSVMVIGSAFFTKRKIWEELTNCPIYQACFPGIVGAFLPTFLYYEETGCSYHAAAHGYKNVYYGKAECMHEWHGSIHKHGDNKAFEESQVMFRMFCDAHGIPHD